MSHSTKNIYIDALKFAVNKMQTGVSFNETRNFLISSGWEIEGEFEQYFRFWFAMNFHYPDFELAKIEGQKMWELIKKLDIYDDKKLIMTAAAYEMVLDYEKLQQTRNSANTAKRIAIASILITLILAVIQIWLQVESLNR